MTEITEHLAEIRARVSNAARRAGRDPGQILIVAVSKQQRPESIAAAFHSGQSHFGESYVQEALAKMELLLDLPIVWHFIGPIQSNKTRAIAEHFQWVHTIDRMKVAERLDAQRPHHASPLDVLIQVNLAGEPQKAGVAPADALVLARSVAALPRLRLRGLMGIPPARSSAAESARFFASLRTLQRELALSNLVMDTLSMGMSADFETAIENGSTCIRIGTAIFGKRPG